MIKKLFWEKSFDFKSAEEKTEFLRCAANDVLDMEIDLDRVDDREKISVSCYRSVFEISENERNLFSEKLLLDFGVNRFINRMIIFVNGKQAGYTYCSGTEQKYVILKELLRVGENNIFIIIENPAGVMIWEKGHSGKVYPEGFVSEKESLPDEVLICKLEKKLFVTDVKNDDELLKIRFSDNSELKITFYENGVYSFKYPYNFKNKMDDIVTDNIALERSSFEVCERTPKYTIINTPSNIIKIEHEPFAVNISDKNGKALFEQSDILFSDDETLLAEVRLRENEHIFGLGENTNPTLEKTGKIEDIWVTHDFDRCDIPVPYYLSSFGYGFYLNTSRHSIFDMGKNDKEKALINLYDNKFEFFFINGPDISNIVSSYAKITGASSLPPRWAFGFWQAGSGVMSQEGAEEVIERYKKEDIPIDVLCIDPPWQKGCNCDLEWNETKFPDKDGFLRKLENEKINLILWMVPFINDDAEAFEYYKSETAGLVNSDGDLQRVMYWKGSNAAAQDFWNAKAAAWLDKKLEKLIKQGASGFKIDGGDGGEIPVYAKNVNGTDGSEFHNLYQLYFAKTIQDILKKHLDNKRIITWQRSGYAGSGKFPCTWGGDQFAEFKHLKVLIKAGQACGLMNIPFWSQDIGGFCLTPNTDEEFFIRSYEWGVIAPLARAHGGKTEPWAYGERALKIVKKFIRLRYRLLPYLYSSAFSAYKDGKPIMAPLFYYNFDDENTFNRDYQYYFGENIMVCPAYDTMHREDMSFDEEIYFPKGRWIDFYTGEDFEGGKTVNKTVPVDVLPMFVKLGSIIPLSKIITNTKEYDSEKLVIRFYPDDKPCSFDFYDDGGEGLEYKDGKYNIIEFSCSMEAESVSVGVKTVKTDFDKDYSGDYTFLIYSREKPGNIYINGEAVEFEYDADKKEAKTEFKMR